MDSPIEVQLSRRARLSAGGMEITPDMLIMAVKVMLEYGPKAYSALVKLFGQEKITVADLEAYGQTISTSFDEYIGPKS